MHVLDAATTRAALPFPALIDALRTMFSRGCAVPPRHLHEVAPAGAANVTSLVMPAWDDRHYGVKIVNIAAGNAVRGLPGLHASYLLHDAATGVPLALLDGDEITARRTAATSALAASWLARADARHLVVVGTGRVARLLPAAFGAVRPIARVTVCSGSGAAVGESSRTDGTPTPRAQALADAWRADGFDAVATGDLRAALADADIVSCATSAAAPTVRGAWLPRGVHLDLVGSFRPDQREADDACFDGAEVWVDTAEALVKSGDLLGPIAGGVFAPADLRATLAQLVRGEQPGRRSDDARTIFKAVGSAGADLAAAARVWASTTC